jgi:hypothetical protein
MPRVWGYLGCGDGPPFERGLLLAAVCYEGLAGPKGIVRRTVTVTTTRTHPNRIFDQKQATSGRPL